MLCAQAPAVMAAKSLSSSVCDRQSGLPHVARVYNNINSADTSVTFHHKAVKLTSGTRSLYMLISSEKCLMSTGLSSLQWVEERDFKGQLSGPIITLASNWPISINNHNSQSRPTAHRKHVFHYNRRQTRLRLRFDAQLLNTRLPPIIGSYP